MVENKMEKFTELLGVELTEEFKIKNHTEELQGIYMLTNIGLCVKAFWGWGLATQDILIKILNGEYEIIKLPFIPKIDEIYYSYSDDWFVVKRVWNGDAYDYTRLKAGIVFRTKDTAEKALPKVYKELTGGEWEK